MPIQVTENSRDIHVGISSLPTEEREKLVKHLGPYGQRAMRILHDISLIELLQNNNVSLKRQIEGYKKRLEELQRFVPMKYSSLFDQHADMGRELAEVTADRDKLKELHKKTNDDLEVIIEQLQEMKQRIMPQEENTDEPTQTRD